MYIRSQQSSTIQKRWQQQAFFFGLEGNVVFVFKVKTQFQTFVWFVLFHQSLNVRLTENHQHIDVTGIGEKMCFCDLDEPTF